MACGGSLIVHALQALLHEWGAGSKLAWTLSIEAKYSLNQ